MQAIPPKIREKFYKFKKYITQSNQGVGGNQMVNNTFFHHLTASLSLLNLPFGPSHVVTSLIYIDINIKMCLHTVILINL